MLAFKSYGLSSPSRSPNSRSALPPFTLPPIQLHNQQLTCSSVTKEKQHAFIEYAARSIHPLYYTTSQFDYNNRIWNDVDSLSCPKFSRPNSTFTKSFIAGNYEDSSLTSLDAKAKRNKQWQYKVAARSQQLQDKYEELRLQLEEKKLNRQKLRDQRRNFIKKQQLAALTIQHCMKECIIRKKAARAVLFRREKAVKRLQRAYRCILYVRRTKAAVLEKQYIWLTQNAERIQAMARQYILCKRAKRELLHLRQEKVRELTEAKFKYEIMQHTSAVTIQRALKAYVRYKIVRSAKTSIATSEQRSILSRMRTNRARTSEGGMSYVVGNTMNGSYGRRQMNSPFNNRRQARDRSAQRLLPPK